MKSLHLKSSNIENSSFDPWVRKRGFTVAILGCLGLKKVDTDSNYCFRLEYGYFSYCTD
jgi:hypothetical protein